VLAEGGIGLDGRRGTEVYGPYPTTQVLAEAQIVHDHRC
jgi:hypothetical protein